MHESRRQMSLGLSIANLGYHYAAWRHPDVPADGNMDFRHFVHCAKLAERGKFDLIFLADSSAVRDLDNLAIARDMEHQLVKHEPMALLAALSAVTSRVGLVPTASTTYNDPYTLTRTLATLDILSDGRAGWNMVTGSSDLSAKNFGMDHLPPHDQRYDMADEFMAICKAMKRKAFYPRNGIWARSARRLSTALHNRVGSRPKPATRHESKAFRDHPWNSPSPRGRISMTSTRSPSERGARVLRSG